MPEYTDRLLKFIIVGDSGVGKSCMLLRFAESTFTTAFYNTVGVDFKLKTIYLDGRKVRLQIWDTAGQDRFRTITSSYYKNVHGVILVYDITDQDSFKSLKFWQKEAQKYGSEDMVMLVIGNKTDRQNERKVSTEEAKEYAESNNFKFFEASALSNKNIDEAFECMARSILKKFEDDLDKNDKKGNGVVPRKLEPENKTVTSGGSSQNNSQTAKCRC